MLTCDRTSDPRIPLSKRSSTCAKSSVDIGALARSTSAAAANVSTPHRPLPHGNRGGEIGEQLDDAGPGHVLHEVQPVRPDVGDGAERTALSISSRQFQSVGRANQSCR